MTTLAGEWAELLARRPTFREALEPLGGVLAAWHAWPSSSLAPLECPAERARALWSDRKPLVTIAPPPISPEQIEPTLHPALDVLAGLEDTRDFTDAWDAGSIGPVSLLPSDGRPGGALIERCHLTQAAAAFLAVAGLRPLLTAWFAGCRSLMDDGCWDLGLCPCCGASPGCAELLEDGRRQLACHLCDARWTFSRLICPLCGNRRSDDLVRLIAEGADEGYAITACGACRGYLKEIDRRARWNAGSAIVEDWGSPHLDLIAHRQGYWRPIPTLIQLTCLSSD
ncbi:MAG TPA: formate dehydrogenase accessory protein FdhE [Vicinamibacterales bacterium]|nr:formate dehydrogenase accessory protein FdhE [Vicinamibacterales bacterium]